MSTVVYQGLQSGLESQLKESRTLKLKLSSPKVVFSHSLEMAIQSPAEYDSKKLDGPNLAGWSSLHDLQKGTSETPCEKLQSPYVHPSAKHSSWWLSEKSLSLCTENLGSETGSDFIQNSIFSSPACSAYEKKIPVKREQREVRCRPEAKKQFPPPLTTLGGTDYLHVRPHREDGRLILKATRTPARRSCFQVDRSNGRLRLTFTDSSMKVCSSNYSKQNDGDEKLANEVTDKEDNTDGKLENNNQESSSSIFDDETSMEAERVESKKILDQQRAASSSCCRCNQSHKKNNNNNNNATKKGLMTSMVQLEPWFLVASS